MSDSRLSELERASLIDALASAIRHDTRNKLGTVRNAAYYIRRKIEDTPAYKADVRMAGFFELIDEALDSIDDLLTKLMSHKLGEASELQPSNLGAFVNRALQAAHPHANVEIILQLEDRAEVAAASEELLLLLRSLLDNAFEAMPNGGRLTIRTQEVANGVVLSVEDSGPGFTTESAHRAFDPFYTTKLGHAGLGLCLVRRIAARHRGSVAIEPLSKGACVTVRFPKSVQSDSAP